MPFLGSPNEWPNAIHDGFFICVHTMVGTLHSTEAEFANPGSQVSATFGVEEDGRSDQFVLLKDAAWCNGGPNPGWRWPFGDENPNLRGWSIETGDAGKPDTEPVTDAEYAEVKRLSLIIMRYAVSRGWKVTHLVAHRVINPQHSCPGARWLDSGRFDQLGAELGLIVLT